MRRRHDLVEAEGGTLVMASMHSGGLTGCSDCVAMPACRSTRHRNGWGMLGRHPNHGVSYVAWSKLWRLAGRPPPRQRPFQQVLRADESVLASARSSCPPCGPTSPCANAGLLLRSDDPAGGPHVGRAGLRRPDHAAGGGILAHPKGPRAGVESFREAWAAARQVSPPRSVPVAARSSPPRWGPTRDPPGGPSCRLAGRRLHRGCRRGRDAGFCRPAGRDVPGAADARHPGPVSRPARDRACHDGPDRGPGLDGCQAPRPL
jgi:hypothetical protein